MLLPLVIWSDFGRRSLAVLDMGFALSRTEQLRDGFLGTVADAAASFSLSVVGWKLRCDVRSGRNDGSLLHRKLEGGRAR